VNDRESEAILAIVAHTTRWIVDHPYAATGIFGAALGSAVTYRVMTVAQQRTQQVRDVFTPKVYRMELPVGELHHILKDPSAELRWETPEMTVIVTSEETVPLKQLPVVEADEQ